MFYSYLSIGTLNLKFASGDPAGALLHCLPTFALRRKGRLSVFGALLHCSPTFALRRKGRLSVLMICFRWVRSKPFAPSSQSMAQPSLCGHQQQQACNTIRGVLVPAPTGLRPVTPRLVVGNGLRPFCVDSEFGLVFYSYLSIGTLNLKFASGDPAGVFATPACRPLPFVAKDGSQCSGLCYTVRRPLLLRRKGRLSVLMICFRWVRSKPFAPSSQSMAQPSLCGHQQQQACNTIRGVLVLAPRAFGP